MEGRREEDYPLPSIEAMISEGSAEEKGKRRAIGLSREGKFGEDKREKKSTEEKKRYIKKNNFYY